MTNPLHIENWLKSLNYLYDIKRIREDLDKWQNVVGWNVHASSNLRKDFTLQRLTQAIAENNINVEIINEQNHLTRFQIWIKP